jgi:hypothetical protein
LRTARCDTFIPRLSNLLAADSKTSFSKRFCTHSKRPGCEACFNPPDLTGLIPRLREVVPLEDDCADAFGTEDCADGFGTEDDGCPDGLELDEEGVPRALDELGRALEEPLRALVVPLALVVSLGFLAEDIFFRVWNANWVSLAFGALKKSFRHTPRRNLHKVFVERLAVDSCKRCWYFITYRHIIDIYVDIRNLSSNHVTS